MNRWMDPMLEAFERSCGSTAWFFRDDDAGWADERLLAVTDVFQHTGVVLDVAAIPAAVSPRLSAELRALVAAGVISVHQHGWTHVNHQLEGRRSEFGTARADSDQRHDLKMGQNVLCELLDGAVEPIFTPPWNRCSDRTVALLDEIGLTVLSCDVSAPSRKVPGVVEVPVCVDWTRAWQAGGPEHLGRELARVLFAPAPTVGLMLHHATMTDEQLEALDSLVCTLRSHHSVELTSIAALGAAGAAESNFAESNWADHKVGSDTEMEST